MLDLEPHWSVLQHVLLADLLRVLQGQEPEALLTHQQPRQRLRMGSRAL